MDNHHYLLIATPSGNLVAGMRRSSEPKAGRLDAAAFCRTSGACRRL